MNRMQVFRRGRLEMPRRGRPVTDAAQMLERSAKFSVIMLFIFALFVVLDAGIFFFAPFLAAIVVALVLGPMATRLERLGIPSAGAAAILLLCLLALMALLFTALASPLTEWIERAPEAWEKFNGLIASVREQTKGIADAQEQLEDAIGASGTTVTMDDSVATLTSALSLAPTVAGQALIFVGTFYFFLSTRNDLRRSALSFCVSRGTRCRIARIFRDVELDVSSYLGAITLINICFGLCVAAAMAGLGLPSPVLWGILAALLNFMPYLGPALMAAIIFSAGLISFDTVSPAVVASLVYIALNALEGQFVTPSVIGRRMMLNPLMVFAGLTFWLWLWGAIGAFLAVPILLVGRTVIYHLLPQNSGPRVPHPSRKTVPVQERVTEAA